nr:MAG TPA: hypothetical protein [Caudoviricetes sp.]
MFNDVRNSGNPPGHVRYRWDSLLSQAAAPSII